MPISIGTGQRAKCLRRKKKTMNTLTKWNPFRELDEMQNRLGNFFGGFPNRMGNGNGESVTLPDWSPQVDISEDDQEYLIKADLPEMKKNDVSVVVEDGIVSVSGERKTEKEEKKKKYHRIERSYGSFRRGFLVPEDADASKVAAEFKEGVLKVHLPKSATAKPKAVEVKVQ
jgi:HSP20 family protein